MVHEFRGTNFWDTLYIDHVLYVLKAGLKIHPRFQTKQIRVTHATSMGRNYVIITLIRTPLKR